MLESGESIRTGWLQLCKGGGLCGSEPAIHAVRSGWVTKSVAADEPCEAAIGCEAVVRSASTVNQAYRVYWFCDRFVAVAHHLERSLVLLVSDYNG